MTVLESTHQAIQAAVSSMSVKTIHPNDVASSFSHLAMNFSDSSLLKFYSEIDSKLLKRVVSYIGLNVWCINNRNNSYLSANCEYHWKWMKQMSRS